MRVSRGVRRVALLGGRCPDRRPRDDDETRRPPLFAGGPGRRQHRQPQQAPRPLAPLRCRVTLHTRPLSLGLDNHVTPPEPSRPRGVSPGVEGGDFDRDDGSLTGVESSEKAVPYSAELEGGVAPAWRRRAPSFLAPWRGARTRVGRRAPLMAAALYGDGNDSFSSTNGRQRPSISLVRLRPQRAFR